jgi:hypothetical protein
VKSKAEHEREVFQEFAAKSELLVDRSSIECRDPPEPDIFCRVGGTGYYFELGRILDPHLPQLILEAVRRHPQPVTVDPTKVGLPERDVLREKLRKTYQTHGCPVDLVLYYDWGPDASLTHSAPVEDGPQFIDAVIKPELAQGLGPYTTVWMYERIRPSVLWRSS